MDGAMTWSSQAGFVPADAIEELTERKMERLTERSIYGSTVYLSTDEQSARQKLAAYEDTGLEPEQIARLLELVREFVKE